MSFQTPQYQPLPRAFYNRDAVTVARALLGRILVHTSALGSTAGMIVETEAYDQTDPASHSCCGTTARNRVMFGPGGFAYVYRSYGMHWCFNITAGDEGFGAAVLLRALMPIEGLELMQQRRQHKEAMRKLKIHEIASGPGRLTQAMGIDISHYGLDMTDLRHSNLLVCEPTSKVDLVIQATPRIGISKAVDVPWRFIVQGSPYVSGKRFIASRSV